MSQTWRLSSCGHAKHHDQKQQGKERVHFRLQSIMKGSQDRNLRRELKQRSWKKGLTSHDFLSWLSHTTHNHLRRVAPPTVGWSFPHQLRKKEMLACTCFWWCHNSARQSQDHCSPWLSWSWGIPWFRRAENVQPASDLSFEYRKLYSWTFL